MTPWTPAWSPTPPWLCRIRSGHSATAPPLPMCPKAPIRCTSSPTCGFRATSVFASTAAAGRLVCFDLQQVLSNAANGYPVGYVKWVYPSIRNTNVITDPNTNKGGDQPDMGQIGASPTFYEGQRDKMVYVPTLGGVIHCVKADTGDLLGTFTGPSVPEARPRTPAPGELTNTVGFTSSASIGQTDSGDKCLFIGSVDGTFYALNPEPDTQQETASQDHISTRHPAMGRSGSPRRPPSSRATAGPGYGLPARTVISTRSGLTTRHSTIS